MVGLKGTVEAVNGVDTLKRVGVTCALCHSTVDNSLAPGIGKRLDGWANRDLNPGAIIALSPALDAATKAALNTWGAGMFDPRHNVDGLSKPVVIPPAYGLQGLHRHGDALMQLGMQLLLATSHKFACGFDQGVEGVDVQRLGVLFVAPHGPGSHQGGFGFALKNNAIPPA